MFSALSSLIAVLGTLVIATDVDGSCEPEFCIFDGLSGMCLKESSGHFIWNNGALQCKDGCECYTEKNHGNNIDAGFFFCPKEEIWIEEWQLCDYYEDCEDGADEVSCTEGACIPGYFTCPTNEQCINWYFVCDGRQDCPDGADENDCSSGHVCPAGYFECPRWSWCLNEAFVCDHKNNCQDGADESNCKASCSVSDGFFELAGGCYKILQDETVPWEEAKEKCSAQGLRLVSKPLDPIAIRRFLVENNDQPGIINVWLDARGDGSRTQYLWQQDNSPLSFNDPLWYSSEPTPSEALGIDGCLCMIGARQHMGLEPNRPYAGCICYNTSAYPLCEPIPVVHNRNNTRASILYK